MSERTRFLGLDAHKATIAVAIAEEAGPAETYGTIATQLLLDRLSGRVSQRRRIVVLPADFIVRKSSGAPAPKAAETE